MIAPARTFHALPRYEGQVARSKQQIKKTA
jgi:hypothetical protein